METSAAHHVPTITDELSSVYLDDRRLPPRLHSVAAAILETARWIVDQILAAKAPEAPKKASAKPSPR